MFALTKTTIKFAANRGLVLDVWESEQGPLLDVFEAENDCEPMFHLRVNNDGSFSWAGNVYLPASIKEEIPAHYANERSLRSMMAFVATELAA
ncbi:TPA: hypothetical protein I8220_004440 [Aeromonas hydrophila]|nr:hypothetical protein [Aeromonas hydrophila]HAT2497510.1 hypothetical protein [Aeromonas hydrophila]HAT2512878.1 hypothetical protein [Aeromonas hydrophila]HAT2533325.1 hypothetical protein [Aeromonas hydrophila]